MAIAKKTEDVPILPNFNTDPFLTSKLVPEGSYAFVLFLMSILEEIITILVLQWYFKLEFCIFTGSELYEFGLVFL